MKKALIALFIVGLLGAAGYAAGYHYRHDLYDLAISVEREKAQLIASRIQAAGFDIALLSTTRQPGQETLLLVHGFAANKDNWLRFAAALAERFHIIALDLPGHGQSSKPLDADYTPSAQADYVHAIMQTLGIERFHMVGSSMGGAIASIYAARYPEQVRSLLLLNPAGVNDHRAELQDALDQQHNPLIVETAADMKRLMRFAMEQPPFIPWPITEVAAEQSIANAAVNKAIFGHLRTGNPDDFKQRLTQIQAPALIIWGQQDRVIHPGNAQVFGTLIPNAEAQVWDGIGHAPMIETPVRTANAFLTFLAGT